MSDEHQEHAPINKRVVVGVAALCLIAFAFIGFVAILAPNDEPPPSEAPSSSTALSHTPTNPRDFEHRITDAVIETKQKAKDTDELITPNTFKQAVSELTGGEMDDTPHRETPRPSEAELKWQEEIDKHALYEKRRALHASRSVWRAASDTTPIATTQPSDAKAVSLIPGLDVNKELNHVDKQRKVIAKRIEQVKALQAQIEDQRHAPQESEGLEAQMRLLQESFTPPPTDIAGFTAENKYNASTEGLIKLPAGTLIPAITATKAVSDYAGSLKGLVSQDIYDVTKEFILIPKGSEAIMKAFNSTTKNELINARMGIAVTWIVLPDGSKIDMSKASGMDREGVGALKDQVDYHIMARLAGVAGYALLASESSYDGTGLESDATYIGNVSQSAREIGADAAKQLLSLQNTKTIRAGQSMNIFLEDEIFLKPWRNIYEEYL